MKPLLINTTPQFQTGFSIKTFNEPSFVLPYHMHDKYEITWIEEGHGSRIIGDNVSYFEPGDVVVLGPKLPHQWQSSSVGENERARATSLFIELDFPSKDFWMQGNTRLMRKVLQSAHKGLHLEGKLRKLIAHKTKQLLSLSGGRAMLMVFEILQDIAESTDFKTLASEGYVCRKKLDTDRINRITSFIFENLDQKMTVESLGEVVHLHPNSLTREFKRATGFSVINYINKVRIGKATRLLTETDKQIVNICYECGFQNLSHFNRYFKKTNECTPSEYRNKIANGINTERGI